MISISRRGFLCAGAAVPLATAAQPEAGSGSSECYSLDGEWSFRLERETAWRAVQVPHTWQIEAEFTEYRGVAWYRRTFFAPRGWAAMAVRVEFEAVFHSAWVTVNGKPAGQHLGKGYTAFALDIGGLLVYGGENVVEVKVDNAFDETMLPRGRSSDWAHDGGIYRPVQLLVTPKVFIERVAIEAETALVVVTAVVRNTSNRRWQGQVACRVDESPTQGVMVTLAAGERKSVEVPPLTVREPRMWHFDDPHLYRLTTEVSSGHSLETMFGIRKIEIRGTSFYLNGERVRLMGVERMAGSNPEYGMAEPGEWIAHDHADMKALNCVYTRVHWPQDRRTLDWCDRHGILIQTEVPTWGPGTFRGMKDVPDAAIMNNGLEQLREMVERDRNHPCIFSWGVCNEIGGQNPPAYAFAKRMYEESKRLDPKRLVSYASHSLFKTPEKDVSGLMDYVMCNEYVGSWQKGGVPEVVALMESIHAAFPGKPVVISEYGYCACTADRPEGDAERIAVLLSQDEVFRKYDFIAGLIFFCYNDYRTHVGDKGVGVMKQRVHGVVDVYGNRKASYEKLLRESSPVEILAVEGQAGELTVRARTRASVPAYVLRGYRVRAVVFGAGNIPLEKVEVTMPDWGPGMEREVKVAFAEKGPVRVEVEVVRPTGFAAAREIWKGAPGRSPAARQKP